MKRTLKTTINRTKSAKNDEHYTQLADIENEVRHRWVARWIYAVTAAESLRRAECDLL